MIMDGHYVWQCYEISTVHIHTWWLWMAIMYGNVMKFPLFYFMDWPLWLFTWPLPSSHASHGSIPWLSRGAMRLCCTAARRWAMFCDEAKLGLFEMPPKSMGWSSVSWLNDWLVVTGTMEFWMTFLICWECHHPNWQTPSFFRGVGWNHQPDDLFWYGWHWRRRASTLGDVEGWASIWPIKTSYFGYQGMGSDPYPC